MAGENTTRCPFVTESFPSHRVSKDARERKEGRELEKKRKIHADEETFLARKWMLRLKGEKAREWVLVPPNASKAARVQSDLGKSGT